MKLTILKTLYCTLLKNILPPFGAQIVFEAIRGVSYQGDIAIDDVSVTATCPAPRKFPVFMFHKLPLEFAKHFNTPSMAFRYGKVSIVSLSLQNCSVKKSTDPVRVGESLSPPQ